MIWETNSSVVIMLAKCKEAGKDKVHQYWPDEKEVPQTHGAITVTLRDIEILKENTTRRLALKHSNGQERVVTQLHYTAWV